MTAAFAGDGGVEESPGSTETRCRVMPGGGDPRDSSTESKPPAHPRRGRLALSLPWLAADLSHQEQRPNIFSPHCLGRLTLVLVLDWNTILFCSKCVCPHLATIE